MRSLSRNKSRLLRFISFAASIAGAAQLASAQHSMPVPGCPGRGLVVPGTPGMWHLDGGYGCPLLADEGEEGAAHLFPAEWHQYEAITGEFIYTGEVFSLASGGFNKNNGTRYRGNLDVVLTADTEAMDLWKGGRLFLYGTSFHGQTLTPTHVGDSQLYSNIDSAPRSDNEVQMTEYWYEHAFAEGDIIVKVGKQDANADFAFVDLGGDFIHSSFGLVPTVVLPTWPNPSLGVSTFVTLTDVLQYKVGVYDGAPSYSYPTGGQWGFHSLGEFGAMTLQELAWTPQFGADGDLPGTYKIGNWYHTHEFDNLETGVGTVSYNYGFWASADQMLWKEPGSDEEPQGLGAFFQYGWSPADRNALNDYYGSGLTYRGLIPNRDTDVTGVGVASAGFSAADTHRETAVEIFYKTQIKPWWTVQPDMMYIADPGGVNPDAFLVGIRTEIVL